MLALQIAAGGSGSGPGPRRRAPMSARRARSGPAPARERGRWRCAAAGRPRIRADSGRAGRAADRPARPARQRGPGAASGVRLAVDGQRLGDQLPRRIADRARIAGPGRRPGSAGGSGAARSARAGQMSCRRTGAPGPMADAGRMMAWPSVLLPQPDSPTTPTVSPRRSARSTPFSAWTKLIGRPSQSARPGKRTVRRPRPRATAAGGPPSRRAGCRGASRRRNAPAPSRSTRRRHPGTDLMASGQRGGRGSPAAAPGGWGACPGSRPAAAWALPRPAASCKQRPRIGVRGAVQHGAGAAALDDPPGIHDVDAVAELRDDGHVVR